MRHWRLEVEELLPLGDWILSIYRFHGKGRYTGIEGEAEMFHVFRFEDGLMVESRMFFSREQALRAAGIDPGIG
jgi:hypothetical protein